MVQKEAPMGVPKADRSVTQMEGPRAGRSVVQMEARWVDWKVDRTEVPRAGHSVVQMEAPRVDCSEVQKVGRSGARMEVLRVARSEDRMEERLEGSGRMVEPAGVLPRLQVGAVEVRWRFPLRVQVGPRAVLPEPRARALPKSQARGLPAWKEAVRAGGQQRGLARPQEVPQEPEMPAHDVLVLVKGEGRWRR